jgi:hypothetical protein
MVTFLFVAVLAIVIFLLFTGPDGVTGRRHRHGVEYPTAEVRRQIRLSSKVALSKSFCRLRRKSSTGGKKA